MNSPISIFCLISLDYLSMDGLNLVLNFIFRQLAVSEPTEIMIQYALAICQICIGINNARG